jgi:hypothetical protein
VAAPSLPTRRGRRPIEKAEAGEEITFATATEIAAEARKKTAI